MVSLIVLGHAAAGLAVLRSDASTHAVVLAALSGGLCLAYGVWLWRVAAHAGAVRRREAISIWCLCGLGLSTEVVASSGVSSGMTNAGFVVLAAGVYAAAGRLPWLVSIPGAVLVAVGHAFALSATPSQGRQGAVQLLLTGAMFALVASEVRRAGRDADQACLEVRRVEHEEGQARVHDGLALLRVVDRSGVVGEDLRSAVRASVDRARSGLETEPGPVDLAGAVSAVVDQFPDLRVHNDVDGLGWVTSTDLVVNVSRATHTLLANIREHANASQVRVVGTADEHGWSLVVSDDGRGFDEASTPRRDGLTRHSEDALRGVGAAMRVQSTPGVGTAVSIRGSRPHATEGPAQGPAVWRRLRRWVRPPARGLERALWISDLVQTGLLVTFLAPAATGFGQVSRVEHRPFLTALLVLTGALLLGVLWLLGPRAKVTLAVPTASLALAAGATATWIVPADAVQGSKLGVMIMAWSCLMLAVAVPDRRSLVLILSLVPFGVLASGFPAVGAVTTLWAGLGSLVAARIVGILTTLGLEADGDRRRAVILERGAVARLLLGQSIAVDERLRERGDVPSLSHTSAASAEARAWPEHGDSESLGALIRATCENTRRARGVDLQTDQLDAVDPSDSGRAAARAVPELVVALLHAGAAAPLRVRGAASTLGWQITLFGTGSRPPELDQALAQFRGLLAHHRVMLDCRSLPGGDVQLVLRPAGDGRNSP
jgi:hypothetical protein